MRRYGLYVITALVGCLLCWGCNKQQPASAPPSPVKKAPATRPAPANASPEEAETPPPPKYIYTGEGRRDPFENPLKAIASAENENEETLTPLQKVDLSQLRLVGIIVGRGEPAAMVVGPDRKSYILKNGVKVGKNNGVVVSINAQGVKIKEKYVDFSGEVRTSYQELQLPKQGGVK